MALVMDEGRDSARERVDCSISWMANWSSLDRAGAREVEVEAWFISTGEERERGGCMVSCMAIKFGDRIPLRADKMALASQYFWLIL